MPDTPAGSVSPGWQTEMSPRTLPKAVAFTSPVGTPTLATRGGERLSNIYGGADAYRQTEAEAEVFAQSEDARRKRLGLVAQETAQFSATSGVGKTTLSKAKTY